jgi:biotin carboxyl carrier protein
VKIVAEEPTRVQLEIAGEAVTIEGWVAGVASPSDPVTLQGERFRVAVESREGPAGAPTGGPVPPATATGGPAARAPTPAAPAPAAGGAGTAVVPPMPGRVLEVRVTEGQSVEKGQILLVLEAMKMRNEIPSPRAGKVADLKVTAGSNVRAKETMLRIVAG